MAAEIQVEACFACGMEPTYEESMSNFNGRYRCGCTDGQMGTGRPQAQIYWNTLQRSRAETAARAKSMRDAADSGVLPVTDILRGENTNPVPEFEVCGSCGQIPAVTNGLGGAIVVACIGTEPGCGYVGGVQAPTRDEAVSLWNTRQKERDGPAGRPTLTKIIADAERRDQRETPRPVNCVHCTWAVTLHPNGGRHRVECDNAKCGAAGPFKDSVEAAINAWNRQQVVMAPQPPLEVGARVTPFVQRISTADLEDVAKAVHEASEMLRRVAGLDEYTISVSAGGITISATVNP